MTGDSENRDEELIPLHYRDKWYIKGGSRNMKVDTGLQGKWMEEMVEGPMVGECSHDVGEAFQYKVLEQMSRWSFEWALMKAKNMKIPEGCVKIKEELEELKDQHEDEIKKDFIGKKVIVIDQDELDYIDRLGNYY